jgi:hypothetical protein
LFLALLSCSVDDGPPVSAEPPPLKLPVPENGCYHGAFPDLGGSEDTVTAERILEFERLTGKRLFWVYFSDNWINGIEFPAEAVRVISRDYGALPFIRMMPRSSFRQGAPDPVYTMQKIIDGAFDGDLRAWAQEARDQRIPLLAEFGTEVNGEWFPWNGRWNGGGVCDQYGDPLLADGPERFRDAYRHLIDICREEKAFNITWFFHVNHQSWPEKSWNSMSAYYPGDDYIDWIGISLYGSQAPGDDWTGFRDSLDAAYGEFCSVSAIKPLALLEFGVAEDRRSGDKALWIREALREIRSGRYDRIRAVSYWHECWENEDGSFSNLRLDSSSEALEAYRQEIADPFFLWEGVFGFLCPRL